MRNRRTQLAYFAGFFDGEGCILIEKPIYKRKNGKESPNYTLVVKTDNTNEWILQRLRMCFGGSVYLHHPVGEALNVRPIWVWVVRAKCAGKFLKAIVPYLILKKPEAEIAIAFQELKTTKWFVHLSDKEKAIQEAQRIMLQKLKRGFGY